MKFLICYSAPATNTRFVMYLEAFDVHGEPIFSHWSAPAFHYPSRAAAEGVIDALKIEYAKNPISDLLFIMPVEAA